MEKINLICVDDQPEVLDAVIRDLQPLVSHFRVEEVESAAECRALLDELDDRGERVGLVISDHVMPGESGIDLLGAISRDNRFRHTRKVLLTGQATHADTIQAVNEARIDHYFEKPWQAGELVAIARRLITEYVLDSGLDYDELIPVLDQQVLYQRLQG